MVTTKQFRPRGRPRRFDPEEALATAQQLFHAKGYDALSVVDITTALGINPPSFYAAYGSKAGLYARILDHYAETGAIPLQRILRPDRPLAESLAELLVEAAKAYAGNPATSGCLVLEGTRSNDPDARAAACVFHVAAQEAIRDFIAKRNPRDADRLADFVSTTMAGMSASARHGQSLDRLLATARIAATALAHGIPPE
ncbi:TetR/AcrR family transcriptional regulator [Variovorax sp. 22077]|uniref:TetR/AcrR family transcriptional regulator n=1 Tax=Variovorax sp. 22077 TaxID=3453867 RepID=UPI003F872156